MKRIKHIHRWSNWWKVKADNSMDRLCLVCGEIQSVGKVNKIIIGYALSNNRGSLALYNSQMPIYWNKKVALKEAYERNNTKQVKTVKIIIL